MTRRPTRRRKPRRRRQILAICAGILLIPAALGGIFLKTERAQTFGLIEKEPLVITRNFAFVEAPLEFPIPIQQQQASQIIGEDELGVEITSPEIRHPDGSYAVQPEQPPTMSTPEPHIDHDGNVIAEDDVDTDTSGPDTPWLVLSVTYPNQVAIGDSVKITVDVDSYVISELTEGGLELQLDSGSLEWGKDDGARSIEAGRKLPIEILFAAGTKDTGMATIVIKARAAIPIAINTSAGTAAPIKPATEMMAANTAAAEVEADSTSSAQQSLDAAATLMLPAALAIERSVDVVILSKYRIPDSWVHWLGIAGWIASFLGAGLLLKGAGSLWISWRRDKDGGGPSQLLHT